MIKTKRVYESPARGDGKRFFVERLWPRGIKKEDLDAVWLKDVAPSADLRKWYSHDVSKWSEFQKRYRKELDHNRESLAPLIAAAARGTITLLYAAHDTEHNSACVLKAYLEKNPKGD